jgi:hypothetical protein
MWCTIITYATVFPLVTVIYVQNTLNSSLDHLPMDLTGLLRKGCYLPADKIPGQAQWPRDEQ